MILPKNSMACFGSLVFLEKVEMILGEIIS